MHNITVIIYNYVLHIMKVACIIIHIEKLDFKGDEFK
jgi:hypothetical protein